MCESPAAMRTTALRPATCSAMTELVVEPLPCWPELFSPQTHTVPSLLSAAL